MKTTHLPKTKFQHLLCDLDGTLIDSGGLRVQFEFIWKTLPLMKKHQGWKAAYHALKDGQDVIKLPSSTHTNHERLVDTFSKHLKLSLPEAETTLLQNLSAVFPQLKSHFGKIAGAAKFLEWANDHYTLTLATNPVWPLDLVHLRMKWGGISPDYFKVITTADRMHACKPTPEYYQELLKMEGFKSETCLMIGNDRKMDLPATKIGVAVFLLVVDAKELSCIEIPGENSPGAWSGSYAHLKAFLSQNSNQSISSKK